MRCQRGVPDVGSLCIFKQAMVRFFPYPLPHISSFYSPLSTSYLYSLLSLFYSVLSNRQWSSLPGDFSVLGPSRLCLIYLKLSINVVTRHRKEADRFGVKPWHFIKTRCVVLNLFQWKGTLIHFLAMFLLSYRHLSSRLRGPRPISPQALINFASRMLMVEVLLLSPGRQVIIIVVRLEGGEGQFTTQISATTTSYKRRCS